MTIYMSSVDDYIYIYIYVYILFLSFFNTHTNAHINTIYIYIYIYIYKVYYEIKASQLQNFHCFKGRISGRSFDVRGVVIFGIIFIGDSRNHCLNLQSREIIKVDRK